jgi:hypothetical protein
MFRGHKLIRLAGLLACAGGLGCSGSRVPESGAQSPGAPRVQLPEVARGALRPVATFAAIEDPAQRSQALFGEISRVLLHPRCLNCHVDGDSPAQGAMLAIHDPPVTRGPEDRGIVGMECTTCHQDRNLELSRVPGAPDWRLPPRNMAWVGKTTSELCAQLKDPARNGKRELAAIVEHSRKDPLVAWGWHPGFEREAPPGSQAEFGDLVEAWVASGASCPTTGERAPSGTPGGI